MRNLKFIVGFTLTGFVLSLFCGFFSHSSFLHVFLQALLFAVIFALLAIIISVLFDRFLNDGVVGTDSDGVIASDASSSVPLKGSKVDFVIQDEELPVSESENQFFVGDKHQLLNESDIKKVAVQNDLPEQGNRGFVPLQKDTFENLTETEANNSDLGTKGNMASLETPFINSNIAVNATAEIKDDEKKFSVRNSENSNSELDTLPDMNEVTFERNEEDDSTENTSFISPERTSGSSSSAVDGVDTKDASLLAKAISSILSGES